ncbi:MAG TPA: HAD-IA family hydrolase [Candidatus Saccharimonadales bacterium]|nr:HAD-IA family hydrolase [Candidatus Saccharimonadales bacterium]
MDERDLGHRLQAKRRLAGLTQQELCEKANLSYSTLAKIERGAIRAPSIFTIRKIAQAIGVSVDNLLDLGNPQIVEKVRNKSKSGISFVYFDINGCLVRFYHRAFTRLAHVSNQSPDIVEGAFWHYNDQVCRGKMSMHEFNQALAQRLRVKSVDWEKHYIETVEPVPHMNDLLSWISKLYGIGLMSNIMPGLIDLMIKRKIIPDIDYDTIIDSSIVKVIKPEPGIYQIAAKQARCNESEILLVDDSRVNLMAADRLKWHVLWFDNFRPEESIKKIKEILTLP